MKIKYFTQGYILGTIAGWISMFLALFILFGCSSAIAQTYYSEITESQYNKFSVADYFYEGQIQLKDGTWHHGWISRFPDSNRLRFKPADDSVQVFLLTDKYVDRFSYNLKDTFPQYVFKEIPITRKRKEKRVIEILIKGDLNLYVYKTVEKLQYYNGLLKKKYEYQMLTDFYIEKNGELTLIEDFEKDLSYLIRDKKEFYESYRKSKKSRKDRYYRHYLNAIIAYNETE